MGSTAVLEASPQVERGPALRPIVGRLLNAIAQHASPDGKLKIGVREFTLDISAWERGIALKARERGLSATTYWGYRLLEALAVQAKGFADLSRLRNDPLSDEQRERCRQDLVADCALAKALESELAAVIAALETAGRRGTARNLTGSRQRLAESLGQLLEELTDDERPTADALAERLFLAVDEELPCTGTVATHPTGPQSAPPASADPVRAAAPSQPRPQAQPHSHSPSRSQPRGITRKHLILTGAITFVVVALLTLLLPMLVAQRYEASQAFRYLPGVRGYTGTPPLALVTVSADEWQSLDRPGRTRLAAAVGAAMLKEGFTSVKLLTPDQKPVAEWVKDRGSRIY
jgi:hypothetical protein